MSTAVDAHATVTVAAIQMAMSNDVADNISKAAHLVRQAAQPPHNAKVILLPELFQAQYFPQYLDDKKLMWAKTLEEDESVQALRIVAKECQVVLPVSFYEKCGEARFNSVVVIDADGSLLGLYRKSHIPEGPGYQVPVPSYSPIINIVGEILLQSWRYRLQSVSNKNLQTWCGNLLGSMVS